MSFARSHEFLRFVLQISSRNGNRMRLSLLLITMLTTGAALPEVIRFDEAVPDRLPPHWTIAMTHGGAPPRWEIVRDESAPTPPNVFAQLSRDTTAGRFPLAIWDGALLHSNLWTAPLTRLRE